jgi:hypothetical protein
MSNEVQPGELFEHLMNKYLDKIRGEAEPTSEMKEASRIMTNLYFAYQHLCLADASTPGKYALILLFDHVFSSYRDLWDRLHPIFHDMLLEVADQTEIVPNEEQP